MGALCRPLFVWLTARHHAALSAHSIARTAPFVPPRHAVPWGPPVHEIERGSNPAATTFYQAA